MNPADSSPNKSVFINCPFDDRFLEIFRAIIFTTIACGFTPRTALDRNSSGQIRLHKIFRLIGDCDWSIHDISAVDLDLSTGMPRFNMPLELGIALGAIEFGGEQTRDKLMLILDEKNHRYDASISDISGQDISIHNGNPVMAIRAIRNWFAGHISGLPGAEALADDYVKLRQIIDVLIVKNRYDPWEKMPHSDFLICVEEGLRNMAGGTL